MTKLRLPVRALPPFAVLAGLGTALVGLYLLGGVPVILVAVGVVLAVGGLLVDV